MLIRQITILIACAALGGCISSPQVAQTSSHAGEALKADSLSAIDPFCFLAGLCANGIGRENNDPPQCESFFREGGETRPAELFLDAARIWNRGVTTHYYDSDGERLVVLNAPLAEALQTFYTNDVYSTKNDNLNCLLLCERPKRLSFLAGIYARSYRDGEFHGDGPNPAMQTAIFILVSEGCEISHFDYREDEVPNTIHFQVKPSEPIARLFAIVDNWQPPHVEWKSK